MAQPKNEAKDSAHSGSAKKKPSRFRHCGEAHGHESRDDYEADWMSRPLPTPVRAEWHEVLRVGI